MAQPYVGEIRMFAGNFAPAGWMFCEGQSLPISENETLFQLIGTTYGGDGQENFALPDLRGRIPIHMGPTFILAESAGVETVTLTIDEMAAHRHPLLASNQLATVVTPKDNLVARTQTADIYAAIPPIVNMNPAAISPTGGSQPHTNFQPYLCVDFIISLAGIFPSRP